MPFGVTLMRRRWRRSSMNCWDVPGNKSFRDAIEALARELMQR